MNKRRRQSVLRSSAGLFALEARRLVGLALVALLVAASASPQAPGSTQASSASPQAAATKTPLPRPDKNRARSAYQTGRRAELSGDWKTAYAAYSEAALYDPTNRTYPMFKEHARFQVIQGLTYGAERLALAGDMDGARAQLAQALEIDPNYTVARERLTQLSADSVGVMPAQQSPRLAGLPRLNHKTGTRDFDFRGTTRSAYEEVGRQFGVTVAFDGDLADHAVRFQAPNVDFETALMVLSRQTRTFTRVVDSHTLFVTDDSPQKVREYALEIEKSLVLPESVTTDEMNETVRMIREMTGITRTELNTSAHTLTLRSTEQNVALAQALVEQIEQAHGEMMLEVDILSVDRNAAHQLGITPPSSVNMYTLSTGEIQMLQAAQNNGTLVQLLQTLFGSGGALGAAATGLSGALPPLIVFGGGKSIFLATVPSITANFSQTLSTVRSAQRILLRAQDGKPATFFVGDRYPIDLALLSSSLSPTETSLATTASAAGLLSGSLPSTSYDVGVNPVSVAVADVNGDGIPDLIVANQGDGTTNGTISILLGAAGGTFGTQTLITVPGATSLSTPSAVAVGNFFGDVNMDIAVTDSANNDVVIFRGTGAGAFAAPVTYPTGTTPVALLVGNFNTNGFPDLAVVNQTDNTVSILLGQSNGTFGAKTDYPVGATPVAIASADFNGDGVADLAVSNHASNTVSVLLGNSDGTFGLKTDFATGNGPEGVTTTDFNLDGHPDLAVSNQTDNTVSILLGVGNGTFNTHTDFAVGTAPAGIVAADFTGGADPDIAVADQSANNLDILIGNGDGTFDAPVTLPTGNAPIAVVAADVNGDGALDLVNTNESSNSVTVTLNTLQSLLSSSATQTGYPSAQYLDLGLKLKATPRLHGNDEVTLQLEFDISALSGSSINGIPILSNQTIEQTIRLRENQTSVLSGLLESNQTQAISGLPWAAAAPGIGYLTGEHTGSTADTELLIIITPRSLRLPPHDVPALYAGRGEPATPPAPTPPVQPPPGAPQAPAQGGEPPGPNGPPPNGRPVPFTGGQQVQPGGVQAQPPTQ